MEENKQASIIYSRYVHEFLFSLNLALVVILERSTTMTWLPWVGELQVLLNRSLHKHPHSSVGGDLAISVVALAFALCIFVLVRLLSITSVGDRSLRWIVGVTSLVALPTFWLYVTHLFPVPNNLPDAPRVLLFLELAASAICAVLYLLAKWPLPAWGSVLLVVLHFGLWGWLFLGGPFFWLAPFNLIFPLAGLSSVLAWAFYVSRQRVVLER